MSVFFPSGVSAMINESPPCSGRINGFRRLKTILASVGQQTDSVRMIDLLRGYRIHPAACHPGYRRRVMRLRGLAPTLESVGGGSMDLRGREDKGVPGAGESDEAVQETGAGRWAAWPLDRVLVIAGVVATVLAGVMLGAGDPSRVGPVLVLLAP